MITPTQSKAARGLLNWAQSDLSKHSGLSAVSIGAFESGGNTRKSNLTIIAAAFEAAGIVFIGAGASSMEGGEGVRLSSAVQGVTP